MRPIRDPAGRRPRAAAGLSRVEAVHTAGAVDDRTVSPAGTRIGAQRPVTNEPRDQRPGSRAGASPQQTCSGRSGHPHLRSGWRGEEPASPPARSRRTPGVIASTVRPSASIVGEQVVVRDTTLPASSGHRPITACGRRTPPPTSPGRGARTWRSSPARRGPSTRATPTDRSPPRPARSP